MEKNKNLVIIILLVVIIFLVYMSFRAKTEYVVPVQQNQILNDQNVKVVPQPNSVVTEKSNEESKSEFFEKQVGAIQSINKTGDHWILAVDLLTPNTKWIPGVDSTGGPYINQNTRIRNLIVSSNTKTYDCGTQDADGNSTGPRLQNTLDFISRIHDIVLQSKAKFGYTASFDINEANISSIYEQCLP